MEPHNKQPTTRSAATRLHSTTAYFEPIPIGTALLTSSIQRYAYMHHILMQLSIAPTLPNEAPSAVDGATYPG